MPRLRARLDADGLVLLASVITAAVMGALVFAPPKWLAVLLLLLLGLGWIIALTTLNGVAQAILPNWVRGRGLAVYLTVFNGAMAAGSLGWGLVAQEIGVPYTLVAGAVGLVVVAFCSTVRGCPPASRTCRPPTTGPSRWWPSPSRTTAAP
jgi:predicted MFS family arabinose efflux permease